MRRRRWGQPAVGAAGLAVFLVVSAVAIPDFWNLEGVDAQNETTPFLENRFRAGGALVFLALAGGTWPSAVDLGL